MPPPAATPHPPSFTPFMRAVLVLAAGLAITLALWHKANTHLADQTNERFRAHADFLQKSILERLNDYQNLLLATQGLFLASEDVSRGEFHRYYEHLQLTQRLPGAHSLSFTRRVPRARKAAFVAGVRRDASLRPEGSPGFDIHPPGERDEYWVIDYIEPIAERLPAFGLDIGTQPANRAGLPHARDRGEIMLTPPFQLVETPRGQSHLVMRAPVYRNGGAVDTDAQRRAAFVGFVGIAMKSDGLFRDFLGADFLEGLRIVIRDGGTADGGRETGGALVLDTGPENAAAAGGAPPLSTSSLLRIADRNWRVEFVAGEAWLAKIPDRNIPWLFLGGGGAISLLLAALFYALARSRAHAADLAESATRGLRRSEERFRAAVELSSEWYWEQGRDYRFTDSIGKAHEKSGLDFSHVRGKTRWEASPEALTPEEWTAHRAALDARQPFAITYRIRAGDGSNRWLEAKGLPRFDEQGEYIGYHGTGRDITAQIEAENRLRQQADVLKTTLENMNQGISVIDGELRLVGWNRRFLELLGFPESLARAGSSFEDFVRYNAERGEYGPGDADELVRSRLDLAREFTPHRLKRKRPDGTVLEIIGTPLPGGGFVTTYTDITAQERFAERIRHERDFRQHLIESIPGIFYLFDQDGRFLQWNRNFESVTGYSAEDMQRTHPLDFFEGEDMHRVGDTIARVFAEGHAAVEAPFLTRSGRAPYFFTGERIELEDGRPGLIGLGYDISERKRTEEALAAQSAILQATLEAMDQGISVVDGDLRMKALNRRFCELLEFPEEMARSGASFEDFVRYNARRGEYGPGDAEAKVRELVERARHPVPHRFKRTRPSGRVIEVQGSPLAGGGFVTTYTDVTEQEQAQEAVRRERDFSQRLIESIPGIFYLFDQQGRFLLWNKNLETVLGKTAEEIRQLRTIGLFDEADRDAIRQATRQTIDTGSASLEAKLVAHDGGRIPYYITGLSIEADGRQLVIGLGFDISERKRAEQLIRDVNEMLERRVHERTAELEASNRELESFSYSVSHDLRAPLRALDGFSHIIEEEYGERLDDEGRAYLKRIRTASRRMGKLIDDLLDLARIGRQELRPVEVNLSSLAEEIRDALLEQGGKRKTVWSIAPGLFAHADPLLMKVTLENLMRNAWKFTAEKAEARIELGRCAVEGGEAYYVKDNGAGFEMEYIDKLFKPFQRLHDIKRFEGTGIGLAIVQRIVHRHGGRVWAESRPNEGATFFFTLP